MPRILLIVLILLCLLAGTFFAATRLNLTALNEPGSFETYAATRAKHWIIARSTRREAISNSSRNGGAGVVDGEKVFGAECASCHGMTGRTPTDPGRWMYPRAADLGSASVQRYSDAELFWIIKNGIRLSGMPAFAKVETEDTMWNLVRYVRMLKAEDRPKK